MTLERCLILAFALFAIGVYGALTRRHLVGLLISIELMLNAANINLAAFAYFRPGDATAGATFALFTIAVAACEMAAALSIVVAMYRRRRNLDLDRLRDLREPPETKPAGDASHD